MLRTLLLSVVFVVAKGAGATDVVTCGQTMAGGDVGMLQTDLVCPAGFGVRLERGAALDMNGHAIAAPGGPAIECVGRRCTVGSTGAAGDVSGSATTDCIAMAPKTTTRVSNVHVHDCRTCVNTNPNGAQGEGARMTASGLSIDHCAESGLLAHKLKADGVSVTDCSGDLAFWVTGKLRGINLTASNNSRVGLFAGRMNAQNVVANGNGGYGIEVFGRLSLLGGEALGNGVPFAGVEVDILARARSRVVGVTCGKSWVSNTGLTQTLGVCADD